MAPHAESPPLHSSNHRMDSYESTSVCANGSHAVPLARWKKVNSPSFLKPTSPDEIHDIVSIGFGPAALAIGVALHDSLEFNQLGREPRVCFLERQERFGWHAGMQLPGATMQISWIKDLATIRNPRSRFTFLNYLHAKERLLPFSNLGTFLPKRREYEDYMRWCAEAFEDVVQYGQEALEIVPERRDPNSAAYDLFTVRSRDIRTGEVQVRRARNVIVAGGGKPKIPDNLPQQHPRVIHSANYMQRLPSLLSDPQGHYKVAVVGAGQSAAETFNDLQSRFPNSQTRLIIRSSALKPSDDSPFVNEIFDPARTDSIYNADPNVRAQDMQKAKDTNYSVVRLTLLEHIYDNLYEQRLEHDNEADFPHQILNFREVTSIDASDSKNAPVLVHMRDDSPAHDGTGSTKSERLAVDAVIIATGYERNLHDQLLSNAESLRPKTSTTSSEGWEVGRDYRVKFAEGAVAPDAGVWLQGCCENTHGLSDTLLSVLASRSGEVVESIFGADMVTSKLQATKLNGHNGHYSSNGTSEPHGASKVPNRTSDGVAVNGQMNGHA